MPSKSSAVKISVVTAIMIAVADMVGIGVFTSLGFQVIDIKSGFPIMLLWTIGGVVALCGALCYAELAAMFPRSGGEYNFLSKTYHPAVGFMSGWLSATVGFAAPIAAVAIAFGTYFQGVVPQTAAVNEALHQITGGALKDIIPNLAIFIMGLVLTWLITFLHITGVRHGSMFQNISTVIKLALILALIVFGFTMVEKQPISLLPTSSDLDWSNWGGYQCIETAGFFGMFSCINVATPILAPFAISLVYVMYSYSGWNAATYIIGEVEQPEKSLPRAILVATLIVTVLYVTLNAVFLYTTPISAMVGQVEVALVAGRHIFGEIGGNIVGGLICFGLISTISALVWIGSRVTMVMGEDMPMLGIFAKKNAAGVPVVALLVQAAIVTVLLFTQSFDLIVKYTLFSITLSSFVTVLGVVVMRFTKPDHPRPYRTWLYPLTPIIFLTVTFFMMFYMLYDPNSREPSLLGLATIFSGLLIYAIHALTTTNEKQTIELVRETQ